MVLKFKREVDNSHYVCIPLFEYLIYIHCDFDLWLFDCFAYTLIAWEDIIVRWIFDYVVSSEIAVERETDGDVVLADIGEGVPFRAGAFDGVIRFYFVLCSLLHHFYETSSC
jgi:hypothetical protein